MRFNPLKTEKNLFFSPKYGTLNFLRLRPLVLLITLVLILRLYRALV